MSTPASSGVNVEEEAASPRVHNENAVEGGDGTDMPEIRMHSQTAAEGPDE